MKHSVERFNKSEAGMAKEQLLAYQWDFDSVGNDFNVFAWFQREFINLKYFVVGLILISLFFELSGNYLYDWLTKEPAHKVERPVALQNACQEEN
ncbi:MAG: hypothetical protein IPO56_17015 [Flavobacteriales bacterium]|nr:hypothetical protein [Flavobacteriales bacterium]